MQFSTIPTFTQHISAAPLLDDHCGVVVLHKVNAFLKDRRTYAHVTASDYLIHENL